MDDGSTDETPRILGAWARKDPRIRPVRTPPRGLVPALNLGIARAEGSLIARQDADDASHPERLAVQVRALGEHPEWDVVATRVTIFPEPARGLLRYQAWINALVAPAQIRRDLWIESPLPHPTVVMRREVLAGIGGYRDMGWPEDYDLWLRLAGSGRVLAKVDRVLYAWRDGPGRMSRRHAAYGAEAFRRCKAHHLSPVIAGRSVSIWGAGPFGRRFARALREEGVSVDRFVDVDPLKIGRRVQGSPVEDVSALADGPSPGRILLVCVGVHGARDLIRRRLAEWSFDEGSDYVVVA